MNSFSSIASDLGRTVAQAKPLLMKLDKESERLKLMKVLLQPSAALLAKPSEFL
jgi:hypothetical protein